MKVNSILVALLMSLAVVSCKNEEKKEATEPEKVEQQAVLNKNIFTVTLTAVVKKDDSFQLYYKNDDGGPFEEKNSLFVEFKGSEQPQDIVFKLPEDQLPNFLRLDFGTNKAQSEITVKKFRIDYMDKNFEIPGTEYFNYFYANLITSKVDAKTGVLTPVLSPEGVYDPMTTSAEGLSKQIKLLVQQ